MILIIGGILSAAGFRLGWGQVGLSAFALSGAALIIAISYGRLMAEPARSYAALARTIEQRAPDGRSGCYPRYIQSLPFYCRRRVILVGARTELAYGADHSPDASKYFFAGRDDLLHLWAETPTIVLIIRSLGTSSHPAKPGAIRDHRVRYEKARVDACGSTSST